jgi:hypothetical protein
MKDQNLFLYTNIERPFVQICISKTIESKNHEAGTN